MTTIDEVEMSRLEEMGRIMHERNERYRVYCRTRGNIQPAFTRRWTHRGLLCAISPLTAYGMGGYVKLPKPLFDAHERRDTLDDLVEVHGGLTYGPDSRRWVGFDTCHAGDIWPWPEVRMHVQKHGRATIRSHRITGYGGCGLIPRMDEGPFTSRFGRRLSIRWLVAEVNELAEQLGAVARGEVREGA